MSSPEAVNFASQYREILRKYMNELTDNIALGSAKNFDEYQRSVGQIEGLAIAERELLNLMSHQDEDD
tara:strand:+ start:361 stop:564 length:204 start_codon:yes stop_codon:yes gene_type:complete